MIISGLVDSHGDRVGGHIHKLQNPWQPHHWQHDQHTHSDNHLYEPEPIANTLVTLVIF